MERVLRILHNFAAEHKSAVIAGLVATPVLIYAAHFFHRPRNFPPGPYGYPYIGSALEFKGDVSENLLRLGKKYGDLYCLWTGADKYILVLNSYEVIKEAYITKGLHFSDREPSAFCGGYDIPENLFNSDYDDNYLLTRKVTIQGLRKFITADLESVLLGELQKLDTFVTEHEGEGINVAEPTQQMITNVIASTLCNKTYEFGNPDLLLLQNSAIGLFEMAVNYYFHLSVIGDTIFTKKPKVTVNQKMHELRQHLQNEVRSHMSDLDETNPRDIIDVYLISGLLERVGMELLSNNLIILMPDAINSGCIAFDWMIKYLVEYPQYIESIRDEIEIVSGSEQVRLANRLYMPLTEAFIMETLRIRSPQSIGFLNTPKLGATLQGYDIPPMVSVMANYMSIHFDASIYPQPYEFKPERFIKDGKLISDDKLVPFGMGRRKCIGENLVRNMLFLLFANIIKTYDITAADPDVNLNMDSENKTDISSSINRPQLTRFHLNKRVQ